MSRPMNIPTPASAKPTCQPPPLRRQTPQAIGACVQYSGGVEQRIPRRGGCHQGRKGFAQQTANIGFKQAVTADNNGKRRI